ncbi:YpoC-like domain-containing protein OS=Lysinibacillus sphaericus OX=1421 GN=LS41612_14865 PE=4 SV=1 [Lysinibacillus sphaericus]
MFERLVNEAGEEVLPINGVERLTFIKTKPGQYARYRQIDELFKETKKRTARLRLQATKR